LLKSHRIMDVEAKGIKLNRVLNYRKIERDSIERRCFTGKRKVR
jgi:hypothetical protein